jgi:Icc-related predicted phosphoesterase
MKIVLISDTHTFHKQVKIPECDVLIHAGDMGLEGTFWEINKCLHWLNNQPAKHIVAIAGNHDWAFIRDPKMLEIGRINYLENSSVNIDGVNFYGSPVQPEFCGWAFNVPRGPEIKKYWDMIPDAGLVDVLITHGPPMGILDYQNPKWGDNHLGCEDLAKQVTISVPKIHVFGHIHGGYGHKKIGQTDYFNASQVNEAYNVVNKPFEVEI